MNTIDHPAHYGGDTTYETIKVAEAWGLDDDAYLFNVLKYISRAGKKGEVLEDLQKAAFYLQRRITRLTDSGAADSTCKPAEQAFRVGARVRVLSTPRTVHYAGCHGEIIRPSELTQADWLVRLDLGRGLAHFTEDELKVTQ